MPVERKIGNEGQLKFGIIRTRTIRVLNQKICIFGRCRFT